MRSVEHIILKKFRTYQACGSDAKGDVLGDILDKALAAGYRRIDTDKANEEDIGKALKELLPKYNLTHKDIWITTKLSIFDYGKRTYPALKKSVRELDCGYIDLFLMDWHIMRNYYYPDNELSLRNESWKQMVRGVKDGLARNIGVSNYSVGHLKQLLLANNYGIKPVVNQVQWHPSSHLPDFFDYCRKLGVLPQASTMLGINNDSYLVEDSTAGQIAKKLGKTPAQVVLRWLLQQKIAVTMHARSKQHTDENFELNFTIPQEDMRILGQNYAWELDLLPGPDSE